MSDKLTSQDIAAIEARLQALPEPDLTDPDNPEWTEADFARARGPEALSAAELAAFPNSRGRPRSADPAIPVSIRLSGRVARHLRGLGQGWQTRVNDQLAALIDAGKL